MRLLSLLLLIAAAFAAAGCSELNETTLDANVSAVLPNVIQFRDTFHGAVFDPPRALDDFTLDSTAGSTFTLSEQQGRLILLYFGYRTCPDFCPTTFMELRRVYMELGEPSDRLTVAFVTVDPERDTIEVLTPYTQQFHPDFIALRGEGETLDQVEQTFGIVAERVSVGESAQSYLYDHTASIFLIGVDGTLQGQYLYGTDHRDIAADLRLLLDAMNAR
jgi:protein SCO1/2